MDYSSRLWNVILNNEVQCEQNVDEHIARSIKDRLIDSGHNAVTVVRYEGKVTYKYTYKNKKLAKQASSEE